VAARAGMTVPSAVAPSAASILSRRNAASAAVVR
jgi:hypothetical protein